SNKPLAVRHLTVTKCRDGSFSASPPRRRRGGNTPESSHAGRPQSRLRRARNAIEPLMPSLRPHRMGVVSSQNRELQISKPDAQNRLRHAGDNQPDTNCDREGDMRKKGSFTGKAELRGASINQHPMDRRRLLLAGGALSGALAGNVLVPQISSAEGASNLPPNVPAWMKEQGAPILSAPYGVPSRFEKNIVRRKREERPTDTAATSFAPLQDLHGIITPNGLCFERHHGGVP